MSFIAGMRAFCRDINLNRLYKLFILSGLILVTVFTAVAFGGVHMISSITASLMIFALFSVWMVKLLLSGRSTSGSANKVPSRVWGLFAFLVAAVIFLVLLQLVPLPEPVGRILAPGLLKKYSRAMSGLGAANRPLSVFPYATRVALAGFVSSIMFFLLVKHHVATVRNIWRVICAILATGAAICLIAFLQRITGTQYIYWFWQSRNASPVFGTFVNRNTFASYIELLIPIAFALMVCKAPGEEPWRTLTRRVSSGALVILLCSGLLMTLSRAAVVAVSITALFGLFILFLKGRDAFAKLTALSATVLLFMFAWGAVGEQLYSRFIRLAQGKVLGRILIWRDSLNAFAESPLVGLGFGCYKYALPPYKMRDSVHTFVSHAHSEYFHYLVEVGLIGLMVLAVLALLLLLLGAYRVARCKEPVVKYALAGGLLGCLCVLIHSAFTVSLHMPATLFVFLCILALASQRHDAAEPSIGKVRSLSRRSRAAALVGLVVVALLSARLVRDFKAADAYHQALRLPEGSAPATEKRAEQLRRSLFYSPDFAPAAYALARLQFEQEGSENPSACSEIERLYRRAIVAQPLNAEYHYALGVLYASREKNDEAERELLKAADLAPDEPFYKYNLGLFYQNNELLEKALAAYSAALVARLDRNGKPSPGRFLGEIYGNLVRYPNGVELMRLIMPPDADLHLSLAYLLRRDGKDKEALAQLKVAAFLADEPPLQTRIARTLMQWGDVQSAIEFLEKSIRRSPDDISLKQALSEAYIRLGDTNKAIALLKDVVRQRPEQREASLRLAELYIRNSNPTAAEQTYKSLVAAHPFDWALIRKLGMFYLSEGNYAEAYKTFKQGLAMNPDNADAYYCIGLALEKRKNISGAIEAFSTAVRMEPDRIDFKNALKRAAQRRKILTLTREGEINAEAGHSGAAQNRK